MKIHVSDHSQQPNFSNKLVDFDDVDQKGLFGALKVQVLE